MGKAKEWMMEMQEQAGDRHLAKLLGISYDDLMELEWQISTDESNEGLVYCYIVEFSDDSPSKIVSKIDRLEDGNKVFLAPWEMDAEYDYINDQFDAITESRNTYKTFLSEIDQLLKLSQLQNEGDELKKILNRQIFIGLIGCMETFLSDVFLKLVFDNKMYFRSFVKNHPEFKIRKFELREIFDQQEQLELNVKKVILDTIFHNLPSVRSMYRATFDIDFPNIGIMQKHVLKRHDLVHRNGKTKDGCELIIEDSNLTKLIEDLKIFIKPIAKELEIEV
tara:strand:- start:2483 stop:3319 length:837 start_codon:yes stop_codon:yes gene_type:complete